MGHATAADLLADLRRLRLLEPPQLDEAALWKADGADPNALARRLVQRQWLTSFQANLLVHGHGSELVLGSYVILGRLGEGGMAQVFKARHAKLGHIVALKVIRRDRLSDPATVQRFEHELHLACQVTHPNVVRALDADQVSGTMFLAMEFIDGIDLGKLVAGAGPLPIAEACEYARQATAGLAACHERGLIHRDIKPSNLLLTYLSRDVGGPAEPLIKILDLGLARMETGAGVQRRRLTQLGKAVGTADYMAPEQARDSRTADGRADLYSLGCTLYFLLAGKPPFSGLTRVEKLVSHQLEEAPRLERVRPDVPVDLAAIVRKLLAKHPDDRYQTAAEVKEALTPFVAVASDLPCASRRKPVTSHVIEAMPEAATVVYPEPVIVPASSSRPASTRRKRVVVVAACTIGVVLAGLLFAVLAFSPPAPEEVSPVSAAPRPVPPPLERKMIPPPRESAATPAVRPPLASPLDIVAVVGEQRRRHWGSVQCVALSPDGRLAASGGHDNTVRVWDSATGEERAAFPMLGNGVAALAFGADGQLIAVSLVAHKAPDVRSWDPSTGKVQAFVLDGPVGGHTVDLAADGRTLAVSMWDRQGPRAVGAIEMRELPGGARRPLLEENAPANCIAHSRDGKILATAAGKVIKIWDVVKNRVRATALAPDAVISCIAVSPDGRRVASASTQWSRASGGEVRLWDADTGQLTASLHLADPISSLAFSPTQGLLAVGTGQAELGRIVLFEVPTAEQRLIMEGHGGPVMCLAFAPDGGTLISGGSDHTVRLWDPVSGQERDPLRHQHGPATAVAFAPNSGFLAVLCGPWEPHVSLFDLTDKSERDLPTGHRGGIVALRFTDEENRLVAWGPWGATSWDTASAQVTARLAAPGDARLCGDLAADGKSLAFVGNKDSTIQIWDAPSFRHPPATPRLALPAPKGLPAALAFAPDGKSLAAAADRNIIVWNLAGSNPDAAPPSRTLSGHAAPIVALAFSADSRLLATASRDGVVKLWDAADGRERATFANSAILVASLAFSPDGKDLAVWSNHGLKLWEVASAKERPSLPKPAGLLRAVAFAPDGCRIATADQDGNVALWEIASGKRILTRQLPGVVYYLAFAPNGRLLATANGNGTAFVLRLDTVSNTVAEASR